MLRILMAGGEMLSLSFSETDTALVLKQKIRELETAPEALARPCSLMRLIHGADVLPDDWILHDHGIVDGDELTLVLSRGPCGYYEEDLEEYEGCMEIRTMVSARFREETFQIEVCEQVEYGSPWRRWLPDVSPWEDRRWTRAYRERPGAQDISWRDVRVESTESSADFIWRDWRWSLALAESGRDSMRSSRWRWRERWRERSVTSA
ncbi:unnamed protein product [Durusdinium trenchii]|uniref:Ubiquitin-like domain-containing protein n=1 Tax=Durusdinium trenchii TaxID=1381693 RepID=A0ABP0IXE0_9DINO